MRSPSVIKAIGAAAAFALALAPTTALAAAKAWTKPAQLSESKTTISKSYMLSAVDLAISADGEKAIAVWLTEAGKVTGRFADVEAGLFQWQELFELGDGDYYGSPRAGINNEGEALVVWGKGYQLSYAIGAIGDGALTFSESRSLSVSALNFDVAVDGNKTLIAWNDKGTGILAQVGTFSNLGTRELVTDDGYELSAALSDGKAAVAYISGGGSANVSSFASNAWTAPALLDSDDSGAFTPDVAFVGNDLLVVWRYVVDGKEYVKGARNSGLGWTAPLTISDGKRAVTHPVISSSGLVVWLAAGPGRAASTVIAAVQITNDGFSPLPNVTPDGGSYESPSVAGTSVLYVKVEGLKRSAVYFSKLAS